MKLLTMAVIATCMLAGGCSSDSEGNTTTDAGSGKATIDVTVLDPSGTKANAATQKLYLFNGGCPGDADLAEGKVDGAVSSQNVPQLGTAFTMTDLDKKPMAFAVLFRASDCGVVSYGCTPANLAQHVHITVEVFPVTPPQGACTGGTTCSDGACK